MTAKSFLSSVFLLIFSVVCFSFAHPGVVFARGLFVFGWIAYIPVFVLLKRCTVRTAFCWGAAYGFLRFFVLMYWLFAYRLGGLVGLCLAMAAETAVLFALCVAVGRFFRRYFPRAFGVAGWLVAPALFLLFDWLRTLGELGFSYGVIGYSQWQVAPLVRSARFFGVWGVSFAIMVFGAWVAFVLSQYLQKEKWKHLHGLLLVCFSWIENPYRLGRMRIRIPDDVARRLVPIFFRGAFIFGIFLLIFFSGKLFLRVPPAPLGEAPSFSVALIQPNSDPWKDGVVAYREELRALMTLTDKALAEHPETQLVVWSETAFVPDIVRHYTERADAERFVLVAELLQYIESKNCAFVLGNNHAEQATSAAEGRVSNFNSALYFEPHSNVLPPEPVVYSKMRLVPFSALRNTAMARCWFWQARLCDHESLERFTISCAPARHMFLMSGAKVSSKQIGAQKRMPCVSNIVAAVPASQ